MTWRSTYDRCAGTVELFEARNGLKDVERRGEIFRENTQVEVPDPVGYR